MSVESNRALGRDFFLSQDRTKAGPDLALCAADYKATIGANTMDHAGHSGFAGAFYAAFPDMHHIIEDVIAEEERIGVRFRVAGTQQGDFMGIPSKGKSIDVEGIAVLRVVEGKVTQLNANFDQVKMMQQLGVIAG